MPTFQRIAAEAGGGAQYQPMNILAMSQISAEKVQTPFDRFNDFHVIMPTIQTLAFFLIVPVVLLLIFRTERMHVKFQYQLRAAEKAHVVLKQDTEVPSDSESSVPPVFIPENNFKLVSGSGTVTANEPLKDELFGVPFPQALRLYRRVEVLEEYTGMVIEDSDDEDAEPKEAILQRWIEVTTEGTPLELSLPKSMLPDAEVPHSGAKRPTYLAPFCSQWQYGKSGLLSNQVKLSDQQVNQLGQLEVVELSDAEVKRLSKSCKKDPVFSQHFTRLSRSDKYIICRVKDSPTLEPYNKETYFQRLIKDRNTFMSGDLRVSFYQAICPEPIHYLAQQVQLEDNQFELRPWNHLSKSHLLEHTEMEPKEKSMLQWLNVWSRIANYLLSGVSGDDIHNITELRIDRKQTNLFDELIQEKQKNLHLISHFRIIFTKILWTKFWLGLHLYSNACQYFLDIKLKMPYAMARPFGEYISRMLRDDNSDTWLFVFMSIWLVVALQLLVSAAAWDYKQDWLVSTTCYTIGVPLMMTFCFNFAVLHLEGWKPPSSLPVA